MSIDMYLPALPAMAEALKTTDSALQLTITAFLLGFGLGPLLLGPLSDSIGRRRVLIACVSMFIIMSLLCAFATSIEELIAYRIVQALSGGSATTIARTIVHDIHQGDKAAKALSSLMMVMSLALMASPAIGGQLLNFFGWRSLFLTLAGIGIVSLCSIIFLLPETLKQEHRQPFRVIAILSSYGRILASKPAMGFMMAGAFSSGAMFAYLAATPFIYIDYYGLDPTLYGAFFALNMAGAILINGVNMRIVTRYGYRHMLILGSILLLATALFLIAIVSTGFGGLLGIVAAVFAIVGLSHIIGTNGLTGTLGLFHDRAGAASATFAASRFIAGMAATMLISLLNDGTAWALGTVVLLCAIMTMVAAIVAVTTYPRMN